ncbi:MAG: ABC transporter ATP-binding protein [Bacteroidaceae bacterium]|nr:ABC transporter ATP-binding protein [Bacteroidaceae bacterium]MBR4593030.1 ABC transporter ATP-binding protein [Bacteroidaceae bacterium]
MKELFVFLRRFIRPYRKNLIGSVAFNLLSALLNVFSFALIVPILQILFKINETVYEYIPVSWGMGLDAMGRALSNNFFYKVTQFIVNHGESNTLLVLGLVLIVMTFFKTACYFGSSAVMVSLRTGVVRDLRVDIYNKVLSLPMSFFSKERKGDIITRMSADVSEIDGSIAQSLDMLIKNPILIVVYMTTLFVISWQLTVFTILVGPLIIWIMGVIGRKLKATSLEVQERWSDTLSQMEETLGGLRIIKAFLAEDKMSDRFVNTSNKLRRSSNRVSLRQALAHPVSEFMGTALIAIVIWYGGTLILDDESSISASKFIWYLSILYSVINPIKDFSKAGYAIPKGMASVERIDKILLAENTISEPQNAVKLNGFNNEIRYKGVSFSYEADREVLHDIDLTIPRGKTIALVGQSGSGKSTLVDLLPRFYDVTDGSISIDGHDIRDISLKSLRGIMGNVNQEAILFNDTFYNNITFGVKDATREQVIAAAKIANAHDFIMETENGYDTNIGDRGCLLSGGQRQRVSIARAILKNPPILILDEATSALDTESERLVQEALERLMKDRTTIAIAHRLSTIKNADEICVMQEGKIVERGTHEQLIAMNGYYKKLHDMQQL